MKLIFSWLQYGDAPIDRLYDQVRGHCRCSTVQDLHRTCLPEVSDSAPFPQVHLAGGTMAGP